MSERVVGMSLVAMLILGALAPSAQARVDDDSWKSIKSNFNQRWQTDQPGAVRLLGAADRLESVKMLAKLLGWKDNRIGAQLNERRVLLAKTDQFLKTAAKNGFRVSMGEKARFDKMQARLRVIDKRITAGNFVRFAAIGALGRTQDSEALDYLHNTALKNSRWQVRSGTLIALAQAGHSSSKAPVRGTIGDRDPMVSSSAIDASVALNDIDALENIHTALKSRYWQVRSTAAAALGKFKKLRSVGPLVNALQKEKGRMEQDIDNALHKITGYSFGGHAKSWKSWYEANQNRLQEVVNLKANKKDEKGAGRTTTFYGIEIRSNKICFILDISGSMAQKAGRPRGDMEMSGTGKASEPQDKYPVNGTKLDVAKYELKRALRGLSKEVRYNIITFNHKVNIYSNKMVRATKSAKSRSRAWVSSLKPEGGTNIFDSLDKGFKLSGPSLKSNYASGVDTIFFLTDGVPTAGRIQETAKILSELGMRNKLRKIKIHVIGVGKAGQLDMSFLKKLATENGGSFVHRD